MEVHNVDVVVGTDGIHQDEFVRGDRPKDLLKNSILTPSLAAALINAKYVNAMPLDRMEKEFDRNEINISKQTMSNWLMLLSEKYFYAVCECIKKELLSFSVNQSDETPVQVLHKTVSQEARAICGCIVRENSIVKDRSCYLNTSLDEITGSR